jgi:hypothetical protein
MLQHYDKTQWKEITSRLDLLIALRGHRLLEGGMPVAEYDAFMEKLDKEAE